MALVTLPSLWSFAAGSGGFSRLTASTIGLVSMKRNVSCVTDAAGVACEQLDIIKAGRSAAIGRKVNCVPRPVISMSVNVTYDNTYITPTDAPAAITTMFGLIGGNTVTVQGSTIRGLLPMVAAVPTTGGGIPAPTI